MTAPKSGKETRKDIKDTAEKGIASAEKELKKLYSMLTDVITKAKDQVKKLKGDAKNDLQKAIDVAVDVQQKAREILSAVHEGEPQDKNLQKALAEAQKALANLKTYLKK